MRYLNKLSVLLFVLLLGFGLSGCGTAEEATKETVKTVKTSEEVQDDASNDKVSVDQTADDKSESVDSSTDEKSQDPPITSEPKSTTNNDAKTETPPSSTSEQKAETPVTEKPSSTPAAGATTVKPEPTPPAKPVKPAETVTISIVGPKDRGTILGSTKIEFKDGVTVFDILLQTTKANKIQIETRGSGATAYVEGIDNIYEFDYGIKSGWVFEVNGVSLTKSIGTTKVKDGDRIECYYTE